MHLTKARLCSVAHKNCCFSEQGILDFAFSASRQFWREARVLFGMLLRGERWQTRAHAQLRVHSTRFQVLLAVIKALWSCFSCHLAAAPVGARGSVAAVEKPDDVPVPCVRRAQSFTRS